MNNVNQVQNIIYIDYTSTSIESPFLDDSNRPDNLANITKNNIVILQTETPENKT